MKQEKNDINFINFDRLLKHIPKEVNKLLYKYYRKKCNKCETSQVYCGRCKYYNCLCYNKIICCKCFKQLCANNCEDYHKICKCCQKYLCIQCWNLDGYNTT